ncbi:YicC/YloC family endoribonuclease [Hyphobacterium marinum]|uniref:YicC/YloC family endoribonuclease n=1 Tax=Hyphobacterium marinum TaxID=3116574 RepID=A0ABU7M061_9PROT|nr:YicC/YloC family endoribonuclease [Hyphobacterium sp. Y6023]MEE2567186.1 YicC/YloC family endoribonuclease [Hyphobacterium sp. Y6023]
MTAPLSGMTGFARAEGALGAWHWVWEGRSVNGRGLEARFRLPPGHEALEPALRDAAKSVFSRGNIQFSLTLKRDENAQSVQIDTDKLAAIVEAGRPLVEAGTVAPPTLDGLLAIKGVLKSDDDDLREDERTALHTAMGTSFSTAADTLVAARREEGAALAAILADILAEIETLTAKAASSAATRPEAIRDRLKARLDELLGGEFPEERLAQEIAMLASKADVREEIDRLKAHIASARDLLAAGSPVGRKLDFLSQEFNREANTLCSKSGDSELTTIGLALKAAVEQFREQVQNVE